jgi:hypothetical protein
MSSTWEYAGSPLRIRAASGDQRCATVLSTVLVEVHGLDPEPSEVAAKALVEALEKGNVPHGALRPRGMGHSYPLLPTDGLGGEPDSNRRVDVRILSAGR